MMDQEIDYWIGLFFIYLDFWLVLHDKLIPPFDNNKRISLLFDNGLEFASWNDFSFIWHDIIDN